MSDVYIWADDPEKTKQILILELKSTTNAHNAGNTKEGMIAQVKRYAHDFYKHPHKTLNWTVNTEQVQYTGIILARKSDIDKELTSNSFSGGYKPIHSWQIHITLRTIFLRMIIREIKWILG